MLRTQLLAMTSFLLLLCGVAGAQAPANGPGPIKAPHLTVEMVSAGPAIAKGGKQTVGFVFAMEDGWHVYWRNAGFAGFPPRVKWTLPEGVTAGPLQFPAPERLVLDTTVDYGYQGSTAYPVAIEAAPVAKADATGNITLKASLNWLVCKETCIPGKADLQLPLKLVPAGAAVNHDGERVGALGAALSHMPKPLPATARFEAESHGDDIVLTATLGSKPEVAEFYPSVGDQVADVSEQPTDLLPDGARIHLKRAPGTKGALQQLTGLLKVSADESYTITVPVTAAATLPGQGSNGGGAASVAGAASAVALAFVGGMLLNLMPCVFPVLFLKALSLLQTSTEERSRIRTHGLVYTLGILVSFWVVVALLLVLRAGGHQFGWGFQLQSPGFVAVLALFLFFFALSLAGVFDFGLSLTSAGGGLAQKSGYAGSFFTGVLATVVATPCVGPFMGAAIGFALAQPAAVTLLVFTSLALGLAAPYMLLTLQPAWVRLLPKPGAWMELLKQITALPLFATVIWLVYVYGQLFRGAANVDGMGSMAWLLAGLLLIALAAWTLGRWPVRRGSALAAVALSVCAVAVPMLASRSDVADAAWQPYSAEGIQQARAAGKAVFVDYTAAWCLSCQVNERVVLKSAEVKRELRGSGTVLMRADWTQYDERITEALKAIGRSGVPTYVIYPANAAAAPDVLPEILKKSIVLDALKRDLQR